MSRSEIPHWGISLQSQLFENQLIIRLGEIFSILSSNYYANNGNKLNISFPVIARRFLPKQSLLCLPTRDCFASLRFARNDIKCSICARAKYKSFCAGEILHNKQKRQRSIPSWLAYCIHFLHESIHPPHYIFPTGRPSL